MKTLTSLAVLALLIPSAARASDTYLGVEQHLEANRVVYNALGKKLQAIGLYPRTEKASVDGDISLLGAAANGDAVQVQPPAASGPAAALKDAEAVAGQKAKDVQDIPKSDLAQFDAKTGKKVAKTDIDADKAVIEAIAAQKCKTETALPAFKTLLWGAVLLEARSKEKKPWPSMIDETRFTWQRWVKAIDKGREEYERTGQVSPDAAAGLPVIDRVPQKSLDGATATWDGSINVGDIFASLSGPGKDAVLFHEYLHDTDNATNQGINMNYWNSQLKEPDNTPSGKNWTETLAYRDMGDWAAVLNLPWPTSSN